MEALSLEDRDDERVTLLQHPRGGETGRRAVAFETDVHIVLRALELVGALTVAGRRLCATGIGVSVAGQDDVGAGRSASTPVQCSPFRT